MNESITKGDPVVEALLTMIAELNRLLGSDWHDRPQAEIKEEFNRIIGKNLHIAI